MKFIMGVLIAMMPFMASASVDSSAVSRAEKYLNSITGLSGDFEQTSFAGSEDGEFSMLRPGKVRLDYEDSPIQLISDGTDLYFFDKSLDQITTIPVSATPAGILVRENIKLTGGDIVVSDTSSKDDIFSLKMYMKNNEGAGHMVVNFENSPVKLHSWTVVDALGNETFVEFDNLKTKTNFAKDYFQIERHKTNSTSGGDSFYE